MLGFRVFMDHGGRLHVVRVPEDERRERSMYWAGVVAVSVLFAITITIAAGLI